MNCPICKGSMMPLDRKNLYVAEDYDSSQENYSGDEVIHYQCLDKHNIYLELKQLPPNPTDHSQFYNS